MQAHDSSRGFTTVELMAVVLIIGILVAVAVPLYISNSAVASQRVCFANQREIEGAVMMWMVRESDNQPGDLAGVIDSSNPLLADEVLVRPPVCPAAPDAADPANPTPAEGAYTLLGNGTVQDCTHGVLGAHGHY